MAVNLRKLSSGAWKTSKYYAQSYGRPILRAVGGPTLWLAEKALKFVRRKPKIACGCFTAATLVWTPAGAVPISEVDSGAMVFAAPDDTSVSDARSGEVSNLIVIGEASLLKLTVRHVDGAAELINTTDEHPFHDATTGEWTRADALQPGDQLSTLTGPAEVVSIVYDGERVPVYNLSIPGSPTYYIGERGVWVHNCPGYRKLFISVFETGGRKFSAGHHVHHRIPQKYRGMFPGGEVDQMENWVGVPAPIHGQINGEWNCFGAQYGNPGPDEVKTFVSWIDATCGGHFLRP
ncbi:MAG: polymorphic toxin-type HINT domain-containing protein [Planctomycetota bacterium]|nr:polymorphic toxin-type HINT domain-containing protein [Planctomycetota bacterium]